MTKDLEICRIDDSAVHHRGAAPVAPRPRRLAARAFAAAAFVAIAAIPSIAAARIEIPSATDDPDDPAFDYYPSVLESNRILCDQFFVPNSAVPVTNPQTEPLVCPAVTPLQQGRLDLCVQTAQEFYKEIQYQLTTLTSPSFSVVWSGLAALGAATTFLYPDGSYTQGKCDLATSTFALFGTSAPVAQIQNKFLYKPIDMDTVVFIGDPLFVFGDGSSVESVQLSVYRRNGGSTSNCRSDVNPSGNVCWTELAEQWVYGQPLRGD